MDRPTHTGWLRRLEGAGCLIASCDRDHGTSLARPLGHENEALAAPDLRADVSRGLATIRHAGHTRASPGQRDRPPKHARATPRLARRPRLRRYGSVCPGTKGEWHERR